MWVQLTCKVTQKRLHIWYIGGDVSSIWYAGSGDFEKHRKDLVTRQGERSDKGPFVTGSETVKSNQRIFTLVCHTWQVLDQWKWVALWNL